MCEGYGLGTSALAQALRGAHAPEVNGWLVNLHAFDYNQDHFEVGTRDEPECRIEEPTERLVMRAIPRAASSSSSRASIVAAVSLIVGTALASMTSPRTGVAASSTRGEHLRANVFRIDVHQARLRPHNNHPRGQFDLRIPSPVPPLRIAG